MCQARSLVALLSSSRPATCRTMCKCNPKGKTRGRRREVSSCANRKRAPPWSWSMTTRAALRRTRVHRRIVSRRRRHSVSVRCSSTCLSLSGRCRVVQRWRRSHAHLGACPGGGFGMEVGGGSAEFCSAEDDMTHPRPSISAPPTAEMRRGLSGLAGVDGPEVISRTISCAVVHMC